MSEVRNTVAETKNAFDGLIRRLGIAEERFSDLEDVSIEISKKTEKKKKRTEKTVENYKRCNIFITGTPEKRNRRNM